MGHTGGNELVGLALSGGGIRSAAFSLGVLQALHAAGVFPYIDYLSTVSGGGWIGSCLSALMRAPGSSFPFEPFRPSNECARAAADGGVRNGVLAYLRDRASALVPSGFSGGSGMLARVVRGALITIAMLMATLIGPSLVLATLVRLCLGVFAFTIHRGATGLIPWSSYIVFTPWFVGISVLLLLLMPVLRTVLPGPRPLPRVDGFFVVLFALCIAVFAFENHVFVTDRATHRVDVPNLHFGAFLGLLFRWFRPALTPGPSTLVVIGLGAAVLAAFRAALPRLLPLLRVAALALVAAGSLAPIYLFVLFVSVVESQPGNVGVGVTLSARPGVLAVCLLGAAFIFVMNTNEASLHSLFRAQIARLFIVETASAGPDEVTHEECVPLTQLSQPGSSAPYHLLNAALNLQGSKDPTLRGRNSDFFVFSKHFVGGPRTGYCRTPDLERVAPGFDLASAMTTSAAAAAPNMGTYTLRPVVLLMAFLNLRLGYWLINPSRVPSHASGATGLWERFKAIPAGGCYFRELASALDEKGQHVYLSDGGHLENTGAYELLRRRCKYVIVCDAEEDPAMHFGGIAALIRFARLDLGVEIDLSLDDLTPDERGVTRRHSVLARIQYPARDGLECESGWLLYLKSSLTGDEHPVIGQYRFGNPLFPHESTANQAFGEAQFEAYRALGEHIARGVAGKTDLPAVIYYGDDPVAAWFRSVEARVASSPRYDRLFPDLRDELEEVDALLRAPEAAGYFAELYPEFCADSPAPDAPAVSPAVMHEVAMRQIHLMASVYTQLHLDDDRALDHPWHRGWIHTFQRWMFSRSFQRVWLVGVQSYGSWFRKFCLDDLGCMMSIQWVLCTRDDVARRGLAIEGGPPDGAVAGVLHFRCDVHSFVSVGEGAEVTWVAALCVALVADADGTVALRQRQSIRARPGFDELAGSLEARDQIDATLLSLGLPRQGAKVSSNFDAGAQTILDGWLEPLVVPVAEPAEAPATAAIEAPATPPA